MGVSAEEHCSAALEAQGGSEEPDAEIVVVDVEVDGTTASVEITNTIPGQTPDNRVLQLQQEDSGEWLVADYGVPPPGP